MAEQNPRLIWRIREKAGSPTVVELIGDIDEETDFSELKKRLKGSVVLNTSKVRVIRSGGARPWVDFLRELPMVTDLQLAECSLALVSYLMVLTGFRGTGKIASFYAPYRCKSCGRTDPKVVDCSIGGGYAQHRFPDMRCTCGKEMELNDVPERYTALFGFDT